MEATESRQRPITEGSMPMLSITSALREIASARRCDAIAAVFASRSSLEVENSVASVSANRTSAPPRAIQPMTGCRRKITAM
jgi:hypothetical protein